MRWHFYRTSGEPTNSRWMWAREDAGHALVQTSARSFSDYGDCMEDALRNGYRSGLEARRPKQAEHQPAA